MNGLSHFSNGDEARDASKIKVPRTVAWRLGRLALTTPLFLVLWPTNSRADLPQGTHELLLTFDVAQLLCEPVARPAGVVVTTALGDSVLSWNDVEILALVPDAYARADRSGFGTWRLIVSSTQSEESLCSAIRANDFVLSADPDSDYELLGEVARSWYPSEFFF